MQRLNVIGWIVNAYDYDGRTALGVAASEGNLNAVKYLVTHGANPFHKDFRGNDAFMDAQRENRKAVHDFLVSYFSEEDLNHDEILLNTSFNTSLSKPVASQGDEFEWALESQ